MDQSQEDSERGWDLLATWLDAQIEAVRQVEAATREEVEPTTVEEVQLEPSAEASAEPDPIPDELEIREKVISLPGNGCSPPEVAESEEEQRPEPSSENLTESDTICPLTVKQEKAVEMLSQGFSKVDVAEAVGVTRQTVGEWCKRAAFVARLAVDRQDRAERHQEQLRTMEGMALRVVQRTLDNWNEPKAQYKAAMDVLRLSRFNEPQSGGASTTEEQAADFLIALESMSASWRSIAGLEDESDPGSPPEGPLEAGKQEEDAG